MIEKNKPDAADERRPAKAEPASPGATAGPPSPPTVERPEEDDGEIEVSSPVCYASMIGGTHP